MYRVLFVLMLLIHLHLPVVTEANQSPKAVFPEQEYNFGKINEGEQATHTFKILNVGDSPLDIVRVIPDCGCTATSLSKEKILPNEEGEIKVVYNSSNRPGDFQKNIQVVTNDPQNSKTNLIIRGIATRGPSPCISVHNRKIELGVINIKSPPPFALSVRNTGEEKLIINSIKNTRGEVLLAAETEIPPQERKIFQLTYQPQNVGIINESITIYSNDPQRPRYYVFLSGYVEKEEKIVITRKNKQSFIVSNNTAETIIVIPKESTGPEKSIEPFKSLGIDLEPKGTSNELTLSLGLQEKK
ncbi:MAG: DUF1573 domain-containing protein [Pseudomonadota bacterium]